MDYPDWRVERCPFLWVVYWVPFGCALVSHPLLFLLGWQMVEVVCVSVPE